MDTADYPILYLDGIACFNRQEYFDSHEVWESLWMETEEPRRQFYKGLIQAAVALHHLTNGNVLGGRKLFDSAQQYLAPYLPRYDGLDVADLLEQIARCFQELAGPERGNRRRQIPAELLPRIELRG